MSILETLNSSEFQSYITTQLSNKKYLNDKNKLNDKFLELFAKFCYLMSPEQQKILLCSVIEKYFYEILDVILVTGIANKQRLFTITQKVDNIAELFEEELVKYKKLKEDKSNTIDLLFKLLLPQINTVSWINFFILHPTGILFLLYPKS